jgi:hypothetical protein
VAEQSGHEEHRNRNTQHQPDPRRHSR